MNDPLHKPITVTILDTVTGETRTDSEWSPWWWAYGNGSCDCNRASVFGNDEGCGERRYYIVAVEGDESGYTLEEDYNHAYPPMPPKCATPLSVETLDASRTLPAWNQPARRSCECSPATTRTRTSSFTCSTPRK